MPRKPPLYTVYGLMASTLMYCVLELSASGRTAIDWSVISLVAAAILWNLVQLGRRLVAHRGRDLWHLLRTLLFWGIGLRAMARVRPEEEGGWWLWSGRIFLVLAVADSIAILVKERRLLRSAAPSEVPSPPPVVE